MLGARASWGVLRKNGIFALLAADRQLAALAFARTPPCWLPRVVWGDLSTTIVHSP
jgi:hypothetical protein